MFVDDDDDDDMEKRCTNKHEELEYTEKILYLRKRDKARHPKVFSVTLITHEALHWNPFAYHT